MRGFNVVESICIVTVIQNFSAIISDKFTPPPTGKYEMGRGSPGD